MHLAMSLDVPLTMQAAKPYIGYTCGNSGVNTVGYGFDYDIGVQKSKTVKYPR
jgi:hypothetical protein